MKCYNISKCRILFLGFTVPMEVTERICLNDRIMPVQTHKFAWSVVHGLENNGTAVDLLSSEPVSVYPSNKQIIFSWKKWNRENGTFNVMMPFINLLFLKHITRFFACLSIIAWWVLKNKQEQNKVILLHGVHSPYMYAALIIRRFVRVKVVTIVTDPPGMQLPGEGCLIKSLRRLDVYLITKSLQSMDGLISLTKQLVMYYAPTVPSIIVEGILNAEDYSASNISSSKCELEQENSFVILYAGGLQPENGLELLLNAFLQIEDPSFRLLILGKGDFANQIKTASQIDDRIVFKGFCAPNEVKKLACTAAVLINPRLSNQEFTQFSFPSKTIEYMASGRPVISTKLPGIPEEYFSHLIILEKETPEYLSALFMRLKATPRKKLDDFGANAKKFILENKNETYQGQRIISFLGQLMHDQKNEY